MVTPLPMRFEEEPLLWTVPDVYTEEECRELIGYIESQAPTIATNNPMYRDQDRVILDSPEHARELFQRLRPHLAERIGPFRLVGINERLRCYRYKVGQQFSPHMDHWYRPSPRQITLHTVLVYLNGGFEGGETRFMEQIEEVVVPQAGLVAVFQHKIRHEGCEVRAGVKYAFRTDVLYESDEEIGSVVLDTP